MAWNAKIAQETGVAFYFCYPHSPWKFGDNENINGFIRQYLPSGNNLSVHSPEEQDEIAFGLNMRPRKRFDFKYPIEVLSELMDKHLESPPTIQ